MDTAVCTYTCAAHTCQIFFAKRSPLSTH